MGYGSALDVRTKVRMIQYVLECSSTIPVPWSIYSCHSLAPSAQGRSSLNKLTELGAPVHEIQHILKADLIP